MFLILRIALLASAVCLLACGGTGGQGESRPNILLVTLDTTRADHLGTYGYFRDTSPRLDALAEESITFEWLLVPIATTLPSHVSLFTSSHPLEHGVLANSTQGGERFVSAPELVSFATVAQGAGYATGGFVSAAPLKRGSGIEVGFETFDEPEDKNRLGEDTVDAAIDWLHSLAPDQPYFLWVHLYDAHFPFEPLPPYRGRFGPGGELEAFIAERQIPSTAPRPLVGTVDTARSVINDYDAELLYQDEQLGRLLDAARAHGGGRTWERTAVVVAGDHGEGLCQHGEAAHGSTWQEQLHTPLLMRIPGESPRRIEVPLSSQDILPTLLRRFDEPGFEGFLERALGHDVLADDFAPQPILSQDTGRARDEPFKRALVDRNYKYLRIEHADGRIEERLFDLGVDPYELRDVARTHSELLESMRDRTLALIDEHSQRGQALRAGAEQIVPQEADPKLLRELCALGYLEPERCAALESSSADPEPSADPAAEGGDSS